MNTIKEKLDAIEAKLETVLDALNSQRQAPRSPSTNTAARTDGLLTVREGDGVASGVFRVMSEPKRWSSGKGAFVSCKVDGATDDVWISIGITNAVADKVSPGWMPLKGDLIAVTGKYEEKEQNGRTYRSIFAFRATPDSSVPANRPGAYEPPADDKLPF